MILVYGTDKEYALRAAEDTFTIYTQMATDCTKFQIEINVYALSDKYTDIASLGTYVDITFSFFFSFFDFFILFQGFVENG